MFKAFLEESRGVAPSLNRAGETTPRPDEILAPVGVGVDGVRESTVLFFDLAIIGYERWRKRWPIGSTAQIGARGLADATYSLGMRV